MTDPNSLQITEPVAEGDPAGLLLMDVEATRPLGNAKKERFCQAVVRGLSIQKAYEEAGYSPNIANSYRLGREPKVQSRIEWLKRKAAERTIVSKETVTGRLIEYADNAASLGTAAGLNVARQATMDAAQINGLVVSKSEVRKTDDLEGLTPHERSYLIKAVQSLSQSRKRVEMARKPANRAPGTDVEAPRPD